MMDIGMVQDNFSIRNFPDNFRKIIIATCGSKLHRNCPDVDYFTLDIEIFWKTSQIFRKDDRQGSLESPTRYIVRVSMHILGNINTKAARKPSAKHIQTFGIVTHSIYHIVSKQILVTTICRRYLMTNGSPENLKKTAREKLIGGIVCRRLY